MDVEIACPVQCKGRELVELGHGKIAEWQVPAGSYILGNKIASVEANVTAGQTMYLRCQIKSGFMSGRVDLQIVVKRPSRSIGPNLTGRRSRSQRTCSEARDAEVNRES